MRRTVLAAGAGRGAGRSRLRLAAPREAAARLKAASAPASELSQAAAIPLPGGATVYRFQQRVSGVKVLNAQAVVSDPGARRPPSSPTRASPNIERSPCAASRAGGGARIASRGAGQAAARPAVGEPGDRRPATAGRWSGGSSSPPPGRWATSRSWSTPSPAAWCGPANLLQDSGNGHAQALQPEPGGSSDAASSEASSDHQDRNTRLLTSLRVRSRCTTSGAARAACAAGGSTPRSAARRPTRSASASLRWNA